jgi:hypothetical protein
MPDFYMKQHDTGPSLERTLTDAAGTAYDLTGATVTFKMRLEGRTTAKVDAAAIVTAAATGDVRYDWVAADTDTAGYVEAEFEAVLASGQRITYPNRGYLRGYIEGDIS